MSPLADDPVSEPDDESLIPDGSLSGGKRTAQRHTYSPFFLYCNQRRTGSVLWWKLLGFTRDRILAKESRRRTGTGSSVDTQKWASLTLLRRVSALAGCVQTALRRAYGAKTSLDISSQRILRDLRNPRRGCGVRRERRTIKLSPKDRTNANTVYDRWGFP